MLSVFAVCSGNFCILTPDSPCHSDVLRPYRFHTRIVHVRYISQTFLTNRRKVYTIVSVPLPEVIISCSIHFIVQEWKHSCYVHCLAPVLDLVSQPNLDYNKVLELDAKIRDFSVPVALQARNPQSRAFLMQKASLTTAIETGSSDTEPS